MSNLDLSETTAALLSILREQIRADQGDPTCEYRLTPTNEKAVLKVAAWLARRDEHGIDHRKSLMLAGNVGSGKSLLLRAASRFITDVWGVPSFGIVSCRTLVRSYAAHGYGEEVTRWMDAPHIGLDDLGAENPEQVRYGTRTNLMAEIIEHRYDRLQRGQKAWTHLTTNLGKDRLQEYYGSRVMSRLSHLCNVVPCGASKDAEDFRKGAKGVMPAGNEPRQQNVYEAISPEVARRLLDMLGAKQPRPDALESRGQSPSLDEDLKRLREFAANMDTTDLQGLRRGLLENNNPSVAKPYILVIDEALDAR